MLERKRKVYLRTMTSGQQGAPYFREIRPGGNRFQKPAIFVEEKLGEGSDSTTIAPPQTVDVL